MTHDHDDILATLGVRMPVEENNAAVVDVLSSHAPEKTIEQIKEEEALVEQLEAKALALEGPWFTANAAKPILAARFVNGKWDVIIVDGEAEEFLDPRRKNLLFKAVNIALRRHSRQRQLQLRIQNRKSAAQEEKEVQEALEESRRAGTLSLSPATRL